MKFGNEINSVERAVHSIGNLECIKCVSMNMQEPIFVSIAQEMIHEAYTNLAAMIQNFHTHMSINQARTFAKTLRRRNFLKKNRQTIDQVIAQAHVTAATLTDLRQKIAELETIEKEKVSFGVIGDPISLKSWQENHERKVTSAKTAIQALLSVHYDYIVAYARVKGEADDRIKLLIEKQFLPAESLKPAPLVTPKFISVS